MSPSSSSSTIEAPPDERDERADFLDRLDLLSLALFPPADFRLLPLFPLFPLLALFRERLDFASSPSSAPLRDALRLRAPCSAELSRLPSPPELDLGVFSSLVVDVGSSGMALHDGR
jgi:hypothetical protein